MPLDYASPQPPQQRRIDPLLMLLLLAGLAIRLAWVVRLPTDIPSLQRLPDQIEYLELGRNLIQNHTLEFVDPRFGDTVYAFRTPGYPAFVALCAADPRLIRIAQALIDASVLLAVYILAREWTGRGAALFSAGLAAFNPFLIFFCGLLLSETLFTALLAWGMTLLICPRGWLVWFVGAILLVLSIQVRPSAILLPVMMCLIGAFVNRGRPRPYDWRWSPPVGTLSLLLTVLVLLPWGWRNNRMLGKWIWTTTNSGFSLYDGLNPDATGASDQSFVRTMPQLQLLDEVGRSQYLANQAREFVSQHPQRVAELAASKLARLWSPVPLSAEYGGNRRIVILAAAYMIPFYVLIMLGMRFGYAPRSEKAFLLAPAAYFTIVHAVSVGSLRYRIPADVPMAILAGLALTAWPVRSKKPQPVPIKTNDS